MTESHLIQFFIVIIYAFRIIISIDFYRETQNCSDACGK
jgi:hypothetical protein